MARSIVQVDYAAIPFITDPLQQHHTKTPFFWSINPAQHERPLVYPVYRERGKPESWGEYCFLCQFLQHRRVHSSWPWPTKTRPPMLLVSSSASFQCLPQSILRNVSLVSKNPICKNHVARNGRSQHKRVFRETVNSRGSGRYTFAKLKSG